MNHTDETGIVLVPHTHWDREWYEPFQVFRFQLVRMFDEVLKTAEADAGFRFTLDGQTAAIDDYLEIRPENRERVKAMVSRGQLALGPWQILLDEFLCSGETIIRNLQMGISGAQALGGYMKVGYLPDMFGHVARCPRSFGAPGSATPVCGGECRRR
ncbi:putative mannosylglycerate hydrolase [Arthrobacter sp. Hiyo6]|nr:putative mannosylglycerate hydrolase [Arthrobacter sp. Hiyo6]